MALSDSSENAVDYPFLRRIVYAHSSNILDPSHDYVFENRLARLVHHYGMKDLGELVNRLRSASDEDLEVAVAQAMTINETSFFRDSRPFELLRSKLLPALIESRQVTKALRIWSAACSTGQEAYSIAILLKEHFSRIASWRVRIDASDFCEHAVHRARAGLYDRIEVNRGLSANLLLRYFIQESDGWMVRPEIHNLCHFVRINLARHPLPIQGRFDVIFLRNVMLYFPLEVRMRVSSQVRRLLAPDGVLFLGSSEQPPDISAWIPVLDGGTCYYRPGNPG